MAAMAPLPPLPPGTLPNLNGETVPFATILAVYTRRDRDCERVGQIELSKEVSAPEIGVTGPAPHAQ